MQLSARWESKHEETNTNPGPQGIPQPPLVTALTHNINSETGLTHPKANGTMEELEKPDRSEVSLVNVVVLAYSYPAKWMAEARAMLRTDLALALHDNVSR